MASHLSDIGFSVNEETYYDDLIKIFEAHIEKSSREIVVGEKSYLVICVDNDIEFWLPIGNGKTVDPSLFEIHYNTHRWDNVINPEWISKSDDGSQGLLQVSQADTEFPINVNIPNAMQVPEIKEEFIYKSQMACFVEHIDVFESVEAFCRKHEGFAEMSFFPIGAFKAYDDDELGQDSTAWINGIVEKVIYKKNSYTQNDYLHILVQSYIMKFDLFIDAKEVNHIKPGDIVSANVWISGKIRKTYEGYEFGNTKRIKNRNEHLKTVDDLYNVLTECWCKETAYPSCQSDWSKNDSSYGQCAITAMLVNDMFGGTIHRVKLNGGGTHYFNRINGNYIDLTREQFDLYDTPIDYEPNEEIQREYCGKNLDTKKRYEVLKARITDYLKTL